MSVHDHIKRECDIEETEKKQKAEQLALFMKSFSGGRTGSGSSGKKKGKSKPKSRPADVGRTECIVAWCSVDN